MPELRSKHPRGSFRCLICMNPTACGIQARPDKQLPGQGAQTFQQTKTTTTEKSETSVLTVVTGWQEALRN